MGCGCGGGGGGGAGRRSVKAPQLPANNNIANNASKLHPSVAHINAVQQLAEERRKLGRLKREQLLKALAKP